MTPCPSKGGRPSRARRRGVNPPARNADVARRFVSRDGPRFAFQSAALARLLDRSIVKRARDLCDVPRSRTSHYAMWKTTEDARPRLSQTRNAPREATAATPTKDLFATLYSDLQRVAAVHVRRGGAAQSLDATTLIHEA